MGNEETFGDRLRKRMLEKGVSQPDLGKGLKASKGGVLGGDLGRAAVFGWLAGTGFPNVIQLAAICRKLDISADHLLFGGISAPSPESPQMERAKQAVYELTDEERFSLLASLHAPALQDHEVEARAPITRTLKPKTKT